jgi:hypothetical protein
MFRLSLLTVLVFNLYSRPSIAQDSAALTEKAKRAAADKQWPTAFTLIDKATTEAHKEFNQLLDRISKRKDKEPIGLEVEEEIGKHFSERFSPVFQTGYAIAVKAQEANAVVDQGVGFRAAKWAVNGKAMGREVIADRLRAQRRGMTEAIKLPAQLSPDELQRSLPASSTLVEMIRFKNHFAGDQEWYAAVLIPADKGEVELLDLKEAGPTDTMARDLATAMAANPLKNASAPLEALQNRLFVRLYQPLKRSKRWLLSPSADLWLIPFTAMKTDDGTYAIEKHVISYEIAGRDVRKHKYSTPLNNRTPAYVIGPPDFDKVLRRANRDAAKMQVAVSGALDKEQIGVLEFSSNRDIPNDSGEWATVFGRRRRRYTPPPPIIVRPLPGSCTKAQLLGGELEPSYKNSSLKSVRGLPISITNALEAPPLRGEVQAVGGQQAGEDAFVQEMVAGHRFRTVVLISHGFFVDPAKVDPGKRSAQTVVAKPPNPLMRCGMVFAGYNRWRATAPNEAVQAGNHRDGVLTGYEVVSKCKLDGVELVALIGCGTGVGQTNFHGDSLASLRYAFTNVGCKAVLGTSWSVDAAESAGLMNEFFDRFGTSGRSLDEILQEVQVGFIQSERNAGRTPHPFHWASFSITR